MTLGGEWVTITVIQAPALEVEAHPIAGDGDVVDQADEAPNDEADQPD